MNPKIKKISYKIYLSVQVSILVIGIGAFLWNVVAAIHDLNISAKGKACVESALGPEVFENVNPQLKSARWTDYVEWYAEHRDHPYKMYAIKELLERKCSEYLNVSIYKSLNTVGVYTNNYIDGYPATIYERLEYIGLSILIPGFLMSLLFGLSKWISWLLND